MPIKKTSTAPADLMGRREMESTSGELSRGTASGAHKEVVLVPHVEEVGQYVAGLIKLIS